MEAAPWYTLVSLPDGAGQRLSFQPPQEQRWWPRSVLRHHPLLPLPGPRVELEGKGAVWMYAAAALRAWTDRASSILTFQPNAGWTPVWPPVEGDDAPWCHRRDDREGGAVLEMLPAPAGQSWTPAGQAALRAQLRAAPSSAVSLTGRGANWMYASAALAAAEAAAALILCDLPQEGPFAVVVGGQEAHRLGEQLPALRSSAAPGRILGVLGDPNSGKSVLSHLLYQVLRQREPHAWLMDCDAAAPTPNWYLAMKRHPTREEEADALRKRQKVPWTDALEDAVALRLQHLRSALPRVVADLPGGNHALTPPQRVPPHREVILASVDAFLILARSDRAEAIEAAWRDALAPHGLEPRIGAVLRSATPDAPLTAWRDASTAGVWRGGLEGLTRGSAQLDAGTTALLGEVLGHLKML